MQVLKRVTCLAHIDLFQWWAATISAGSVFLALVGVYLYVVSRKRRKKSDRRARRFARSLTDFIFVWVLLGLLIFYIVSIEIGSDLVFAAGNIFVEVALIIYLLRNRTRKSEEA
jgi:heme A synthase